MPRVMLITLCLAVAVFLATIPAASSRAQEPQAAAYAGGSQCAQCHEDIATGLQSTVHGHKGFDMRSDKGCETCHGPGAAHIEEGGDITKIKSFKTLEAEEASAVCLECHESGRRTFWAGSTHESRDLACIQCHTIHAGESDRWQLKTATVEETCYGCHAQIKAQVQRTSHHPIREGLLSCNSCHNPHGTMTEKLIEANSMNEKCYECHTEKRGPFLWEHPPVRESCLNCHQPHGSNHPKLTTIKRPYLCQQCHLDTRHPGSLYDAQNLLTNTREFNRACSNCHLNIHGSNHPSGAFFLR